MYIKRIEWETDLGQELLLSDNIVALGAFDGLHRGHMSLIERAVELAAESSAAKSCVFTFESAFGNPSRITSNVQREEILRGAGVDFVVMQSFTEAFRALSPNEFFDRYIVGALNAKTIITGFNYRFGCMGAGDNRALSRMCAERGVEHIVIAPVISSGAAVSSTRIRSAVRGGDLTEASRMLGRYFCIRGKVAVGDRIGASLGFPTANTVPEVKYIMPPHGVYCTMARVGGRLYQAVTNCGGKPTIRGGVNAVETYIIDFDGNIYDESIEVYFVEKIREIVKFASVEALSARLAEDVKESKQILDKLGHIC